jgi:hypothetical protein
MKKNRNNKINLSLATPRLIKAMCHPIGIKEDVNQDKERKERVKSVDRIS